MGLLEMLKKNATVLNTKGGEYYQSGCDANLDIYAGISRYNDSDEIIRKFDKALFENETLALANLLYILDIRNGKGERIIFKTIFRHLCQTRKELALVILPKISKLGRWDYILEGIDTLIDEEVIELMKEQLEKDKKSDNVSLLAKWLPSHRTHNVNNELARVLMKKLNLTEKEYRKILAELRKKIGIIETKLTIRDYSSVDFEKVPTKAMLKYRMAFEKNCKENYERYLEQVANGEKKINTTGLYCYEIVKNIVMGLPVNSELFNVMWENQRNILSGYDKNILVIADTSGSMMGYGCLPYANSLGLAIYIAERNHGYFHNHFITFSERPRLQEVIGKDIKEKVCNIECEVANTDIDKVFELVIETSKQNNIGKDEMPSHIIIISDMEFDSGIYSKQGTNLEGWRKEFEKSGYNIPKIIFWNVACNTMGLPATKYDNNVLMVSGFSTVLLDNLLNLDGFSPVEVMLKTLEKYVIMLQEESNDEALYNS